MNHSALQRLHASSTRRWPLVVSLVATLSFLGITIALLLDLRSSIETRTHENANNLLKALERDIARNIEVLDLSLQAVVEGVGRPDVLTANPAHRNMILFDRSTTASGLGAMLVYDARGRVVFDAGGVEPRGIAPATDREYFQAQKASDQGLFISVPYLSRIARTTVIGLSRRISAPDGAFAGVAIGSIETSYFEKLFDQLRLGPGSVVSLVREDGTVLLRQQDGRGLGGPSSIADSPLFADVRKRGHGTMIGFSPIDGAERFYAFTRVGDRPIYLSIGLSQAGVLAEWRDKAALLLTLALVISILLVSLTVWLTRELRRRDRTELALERLNGELAELSVTDSLTGLGNRRAFDAALSREVRRADRTGRPLALVMLDVDHFKLFNDRYGHQAGDRALRLVARTIRAATGPDGDGAFRIGGEEFAILLTGTDLAGGVAVAEALRTRLHAADLPHEGSPLGILTASLGVTPVGSDEAATAIARADAALYSAKRTGRDRVVVAPAKPPADTGPEDRSAMTIVTIGRRPYRRAA